MLSRSQARIRRRVAVGDNQRNNFVTPHDMNSYDINIGVSTTYDVLHRSPGVVRNMQACRV